MTLATSPATPSEIPPAGLPENSATLSNAAPFSIADILSPLRNAGWISEQNDQEDDLSVLFAVLVRALDIHKTPGELCSVLPFLSRDEQTKEQENSLGLGLNLVELLNAMASLGKVAHPMRVDLKRLDQRLFPCLFVADKKRSHPGQAFVVMAEDQQGDEKSENKIVIFPQGATEPEELELQAPIKGTAYVFVNDDDDEDILSQKRMDAAGHSWFRALLEKFKSSLGPVWLLGGVLTILALVSPLFIMLVYDRVIGGHAPEALMPLLVGAVLALSIEAGLRAIRAQTLSWYGARLDYIVSTHIFERLIKLPVLFTERASVAAQIARVRAFDAVRSFFTGSQMIALAELPFTLLLIGVIAILAGPMAVIPVIAAILYGLLFITMRQPIRTAMRLAAQAGNVRQEMQIETFEKIDSLRAGGLTGVWFRDYRDRSGKCSMAGFHAAWLGAILEALSHALYVSAGLTVICVGVLQIWSGAMSAGALIACLIIIWRVLAPMQTLTNALPKLVQLQNAIAQINRLMKIENEAADSTVTARLNQPKGEVDFKKVGLRYTKDSDPVFTGLSFKATPGELIAITGGNGSGKSTVLKLMNGLYRPQAGAIHIDGIDIRQIEPQHLRSHITYMPQTPNLFCGSIADNLRFADPLVSDDKIKEALEFVDLWSYVKKLPMGLMTMIDHHGAQQLPAGLSYNISLARAYVKDTPVMVFDELPYAFLNSAAGDVFKDKLQQWKGSKTVFMVTHREDYMQMADQVILLRRGRAPLADAPDHVIETIYKEQEAA